MRRALIGLLATAYLLGNFIALLVAALFYAGPGDENVTPQNETAYAASFIPVAICVVLAIVVCAALAVSRRRVAPAAFATHVALLGVVLAIALPLATSHGKILIPAFALAVEGAGAIAVLLGLTRTAPSPSSRPQAAGQAHA